MVNSNVPRYSNLASELHRNYLFKFNCSNCSVFSSIKHAHDGSVVRTDYKLVQFQLQQLYGEIVQLQSALNDDYNNVQEKSNMYHISEPIIRRFFSKTCATLFTFEQFSLTYSALQWNAATLREVLAPFSFSHVIDSCLNFFSHFSRSFWFSF